MFSDRIARVSFVALLTGLAAGTPAAAEGGQIGVDLQRYPVGTIASLVYRHPVSERGDLWFGVGHNDADREDNGEFDDEQASGPGLSIGYRHSLADDRRGWSVGGRVDLWALEVDWIDRVGTPFESRGTTETLVLQPTAPTSDRARSYSRACRSSADASPAGFDRVLT